jgi:hypothetical protein
MEALLAMSLVSAGKDIAGKVVDACSSAYTKVSNTGNTSFNSVLTSEVDKTNNPYSVMTSAELSASRSELEKKLAGSPELKAFIGDDKSFTIKRQGDDFVVERSDGTIWKIPSDSKVAETAESYCQCRSAQAELDGGESGRAGWKIVVGKN